MDGGRPQDLGRDVDADDEEESEVDNVVEDVEAEDTDRNSEWSYPDSDDSGLPFISEIHWNNQFQQLAASLMPMEEKKVKLQEELWDCVPEEILWNILVRLPVTTQCRFRCVCSRWKLLLSAPSSSARRQVSQVETRPLCTIMAETDSSKSWFFSHAEKKWYRLPFRPQSCVDIEWRLEAADGGLVCYQSPHITPPWLLVCNPITGASQIVPPCRLERGLEPNTGLTLRHFVVGKESNSFIIVMMFFWERIYYFDSKTRVWSNGSQSGYGFHIEDNELVQKNIIHSQFQQFHWYEGGFFKSKDSEKIEATLPCNVEEPYHIICCKEQVMLVQFCPRLWYPIRIWTLVTEVAPALWLSKWEEVEVEVPDSVSHLVDKFWGCWFHGNQSICFATCATQHWLKHTFATRTWRVMPSLADSDVKFTGYSKWLHWEPSLDMHVDAVEVENLAELTALQGRRINNAAPG